MTTIAADSQRFGYRDESCPVEERVDDLLEKMTVEEKVAQLGSAWVFQLAAGPMLHKTRGAGLLGGGLGHVTRLSGASHLVRSEAATLANSIQRFLVERTRLGIPAIIHEEVCSGLMARGATVFPQAIGLASTWDPSLIQALADSVRVQMRAVGAHQGLSPVLDVCRDPRWGRTEETLGEDPYLVARMGVAFVRGLQGDDLRDGVIATAKHFVGYGASEGGMNWAPAHIAPREMREVYLHPFEAVVRTAGLQSMMNSYQELDGVPCGMNRGLLTEILRHEWAFDGVVVSDYFSIRQLFDYHRVAATAEEAAAVALSAGLDVELPSTDCYGAPLMDALESRILSDDVLDTAVRRVLRAKFELGLFENPYVDAADSALDRECTQDRELARRIAGKSFVLLRNDGLLPLKVTGNIAVIGPNADNARHLFGDYTYPAHVEAMREMRLEGRNLFDVPDAVEGGSEDAAVEAATVLDALRERFGSRVTFARGCDVMGSSRDGFDAAVKIAADADVAVMVMGDKSGLTDDCSSGESRDCVSLHLPGVQEDLVRAVIATGTPVVLVLVAGRPSASAWIHEHCAAVLMAWMPGQEGAAAIADALTGEVNPGGKLPISYPRTAGQIPVFYAHKTSGGRSHWKGDYVDSSASPLYPFGYGLSYTTFALSGAKAGPAELQRTECVMVEVTVTNTGRLAGDEVVQLYARRLRARVTRPVLELKSFVRVELEVGESKRVMFEVPAGQLGFYDRDLSYSVEPGVIDFFVGASSEDLASAGSVTILPGQSGLGQGKVFDGSVTVG